MNCPKCHRILAVSLSVCPTCGAMKNDSVREELEAKISSSLKPITAELKAKAPMPNKPIQPPVAKPADTFFNKTPLNKPIVKAHPAVPAVVRTETAPIHTKMTSPTLLDFSPKEDAMPKWRVELLNNVRQNRGKADEMQCEELSVVSSPNVVRRTNGATALKAEVLEIADDKPLLHEHPTVANALRRIEESRKKFYAAPESEMTSEIIPAEPATRKDYPFYIAAKTETVNLKTETVSQTNFTTVAKPKLVTSLHQESQENQEFDTNKLPPLEVKISSSFEKTEEKTIEKIEPQIIEKTEAKNIIKPTKVETIEEPETEEIVEVEEVDDDYAPFPIRFNAGVFDLLIGAFASLILLSPFMIFGGEWFTLAGLFAFLATTAIVMFVYMTTAVGLFGKTFGMKMFSLELIDIEENDYPTFHQAAVSSSVYLLSLALGGTGFLTVPFTADGRAVHDIVSGTLVVRECE